MVGKLQPLPDTGSRELELLGSTWMDDLSLLLRARDSTALLDRLCAGATVLLDTCLAEPGERQD